jgi:hypothetical protein
MQPIRDTVYLGGGGDEIRKQKQWYIKGWKCQLRSAMQLILAS